MLWSPHTTTPTKEQCCGLAIPSLTLSEHVPIHSEGPHDTAPSRPEDYTQSCEEKKPRCCHFPPFFPFFWIIPYA